MRKLSNELLNDDEAEVLACDVTAVCADVVVAAVLGDAVTVAKTEVAVKN